MTGAASAPAAAPDARDRAPPDRGAARPSADALAEVCKRATKAFDRAQSFVSLMREAYEYAMPDRDAYGGQAPGQKRTGKVFDSTAPNSVMRFANRLQSVLFPPGQRWAKLVPGTEVPAASRDAVQEALDQIQQVLFSRLAQSNFDQASNEMCQDLAAGMGALLIERGRTRARPGAPALRFTAVPAALVAIEEGPFGAVEAVFHRHTLSARNVARAYPDGMVPASLADKARDEPDADVVLLQATHYDADADAWRFDVVFEAEKHCIVRRTYRTSPWVVMRWSKAPGEVHGRGPLLTALPDIKTANKVVELVLRNAALSITGVYTARDDGVLNPATIRIVPGAVIPVASNGGHMGRSLDVLPRAGDFDLSQILLEQLRHGIQSMLFDKRLPPDAGAVRSATEIVERIRDLQQDIGAAFGRLTHEGVVPVVVRCLDVLDELGEIALPLRVDGKEVEVVPVSPLATAQALEDVQTVAEFAQFAAALGGQAALESGLKVADASAWIAERMGVPAKLIPSEEERAEAAQARQRTAEMEMMARSPAVAQVARNVTDPRAAAAAGGAGAPS